MTNTPVDILKAHFAEDLLKVSSLSEKSLVSENAPTITEILSSLMKAGGKRLRPILTLAAARMHGCESEFRINLAAAIEMVHSATLLHDDVVDESERRRGKLSANARWGNRSSILSGDFVFARGIQLMVETGSLRSVDVVSKALTVMAEGEIIQMASANGASFEHETYLKIIRGKTAALFSAAAEIGGIIAGASDYEVSELAKFGDCLGMGFQMADDILDYIGESDSLGKNVGDDFRERKLTLPVVKSFALAGSDEKNFWQQAFAGNHQEPGDLGKAMEVMKMSSSFSRSKAEAKEWVDRANRHLGNLPNHPVQGLLNNLADYIVESIPVVD